MFRTLIFLAACYRDPHVPPTPPPAVAVAVSRPSRVAPHDPPVMVHTTTGALAVVEVSDRIDECSNAGGEHYVLRILNGAQTGQIAHAGGHGQYLHLIPAYFGEPETRSRFYVAELELHGILDPDADGNPDSSRSGWCLDRLPTSYDAVARRLVRAGDRDEAERLLARYATHPLPPLPAETWNTVVIDPP